MEEVKGIESLSLEELQEMKRSNYQQAKEDKTLYKIGLVCKYLGSGIRANYGPKYEFLLDDIRVYKDDYGHYMTVKVGEKEVCSTHPCDNLFAPGEWVQKILSRYPDALENKERRESAEADREKNKLAKQLGLI